MKPRRDITLGEMQDECLKHKMCEGCPHAEWCGANSADGWDLTDPPRFNEQQMAFLKGCYEIGIVGIMRSGDGSRTHFFTKFETIGWLKDSEIPLKIGETLDLAELIGKDAI